MTRSILREYSVPAWVFAFGTDSTGIVAYKYHNWLYAVSIQKSDCHSSSSVSEEVAFCFKEDCRKRDRPQQYDQSRLGHEIYRRWVHRILHLRERSRRLQRDDAWAHFRQIRRSDYEAARTRPGVPLPIPPRLDKLMKCMDKRTGKDQYVTGTVNGTGTSNGGHLDPGHAGGTSVDIKPVGTPSKGPNDIFCCAQQCEAVWVIDERKTKFHYHIMLEM